MSKQTSSLKQQLIDTVQTNGTLVTAFAALAIFIGGIAIIENPANWWIALLSIAGAFIGVFVLINAVAVIKFAITTLVLIMTSAFAFQSGVLIDSSGPGAFFWMGGTWLLFFASLSVSYFIPSSSSRWNLLTFILIAYFVMVFTLSAGLSLSAVALASIPTLTLVYALLYRFGVKSIVKEQAMPQNFKDSKLAEAVASAAAYQELEARPHNAKHKETFIVWSDKAYLLYPVSMEQAFGMGGTKKRQQLFYKGKPINNWLRSIAFSLAPTQKARGASIMLVLLDMKNANGKDPKVLGVTMPDSKAVVPVGVFPGKLLTTLDEAALKAALSGFEEAFSEFNDPLKPKQITALSEFGAALQK